MKKCALISVVVCALLLTISAWAQAEDEGNKRLKIQKGNMQLEGQLGLSINSYIPEEGDSQTGFILAITPSIGYFVANGFELMFTFVAEVPFGERYENSFSTVGFGLGFRFIADIGGSLYPYIGATAGLAFIIPEGADTLKAAIFSIPFGLMIPVSDSVAVSLGLGVNILLSLEEYNETEIDIGIGFLGVSAFF